MTVVRAAVTHAPGDVRVEDVEVPDPGPGEVLVDMRACGICGSDLLDWYVERKAPTVLGHEVVGTVVAVGDGPGAGDLPAPGTRVFAHHHVPCLDCELCRRGRQTRCATFASTRLVPGGLASRFLVPAENARVDLLPIPDHVGDDDATLVEPLGCVVRALDLAGLDAADRVLVVGVGQMGLLHVQAVVARGCAEVIAADPLPVRRDLAAGFGAVVAEADAASVRSACSGRPTVAVVTTGAPAALDLALEVVADGGRVVLFAPGYPDRDLQIAPVDFFFRELTLLASYSAGPDDVRAALDLVSSGAVTSARMTTHRIPLEDTPRAFEVARSTDSVRVVVTGPGA